MGLFTHTGINSADGGHERRVHLRLHCAGIVQVRFFPEQTLYDAILYDISMGGCGLKIEERANIQVSSLVEIQIQLRGLVLNLQGVVRSVLGQGNRAGIEFLGVKPDESIRLYQVMGMLMEQSDGRVSVI
jgi:c-di-GMP-binding flagellar brake protein YcgR